MPVINGCRPACRDLIGALHASLAVVRCDQHLVRRAPMSAVNVAGRSVPCPNVWSAYDGDADGTLGSLRRVDDIGTRYTTLTP